MTRRGWFWFAGYAVVSIAPTAVAVWYRASVAAVDAVLLAVGVVAGAARWLWVTR